MRMHGNDLRNVNLVDDLDVCHRKSDVGRVLFQRRLRGDGVYLSHAPHDFEGL